MKTSLAGLVLLGASVVGCGSDGNGQSAEACVLASGGAAAACVSQYVAAVGACREQVDHACEAALRVDDGTLAALLGATEEPVRSSCTAEDADKLTFRIGLDDLVAKTAQACRTWAEDLVQLAYTPIVSGRTPEALACQHAVSTQLSGLHDEVVRAYGEGCYVPEFSGEPCDRTQRDGQIMQARAAAKARIADECGAMVDSGRIDTLMDGVVARARHLAQRVYPPLNLGPTGFFGPHPVGVRTFDLVDPSRPNPVGSGFRTLTTDVYYPSTPEVVAGKPRDTQQILVPAPTYRDVPRAPGSFPLIVYSHGGGGIRFESAFKLAHLASHGFVVISADHPGSDWASVDDPDDFENRPLDVSFLIDRALALNSEPGNVLEGAIDPQRIGGEGWSFGGYGVLALTTGPFFRGTFTDPRLKAALTLDGAMGFQHWGADAPAVFATSTIPTLSLGGDNFFSISLAHAHEAMFDALTPGPPVMGYGVLHDAGHSTFPDHCEVPAELLGTVLNGGGALECVSGFEPRAISSRFARHIINYLALNFFDGVLNENAEALARLDPEVLAGIEDLVYQSK